jgi:hypothetical protein
MQDHERVERCDAAIAAHVPAGFGRAAGGSDLECEAKRSIAEGSAIAASAVVNAGGSSDFGHPIVGSVKFIGDVKRGAAEACFEDWRLRGYIS